MNPWLVILLLMAAAVFGLDRLIRKKKWAENTKEEKVSLLVNMFSVGVYAFASVVGMLWGLAAGGAESVIGEVISEVTYWMAGTYFIVALVAVVLSFVLRAAGKAKASTWTNIIALLYIVVVLTVNTLAGAFL